MEWEGLWCSTGEVYTLQSLQHPEEGRKDGGRQGEKRLSTSTQTREKYAVWLAKSAVDGVFHIAKQVGRKNQDVVDENCVLELELTNGGMGWALC